jgi:hypothetical protein
MQLINGYHSSAHRSKLFEFRLYHLNKPQVKVWRKLRRGGIYPLDEVDKLAIQLSEQKLVALDCAGWYFESFGISTQCLESSNIAKLYWPNSMIEPDLLVHKPTYVNNDLVLVKFPHFLRYATLNEFINFLNLWVTKKMILNFSPIHIQHNHLKFKLIDIVKTKTDLNIELIRNNLWVLSR